MKKSTGVLLVALLAILLTSGMAYSFYRAFFMPNDQVVAAFAEGKLNVVIGGDVADAQVQPEIIDGRILLPYDIIRKYIDPYINWDQKLHKLTITTKDRVIRMKSDSLQAYVNNKPVTLNIPSVEKDGTVLVPIEFLSEFYNIQLTYNKNSNVIIIDHKNEAIQTAEPTDRKAVVRTGRTIHYPIIKRLDSPNPSDNRLLVFDEYEKWYKVRTSDGAVGYIEKKYAALGEAVEKTPPQEEAGAPLETTGKKLVVAWDFTYGAYKDLAKKKTIDGLDVISPTWFEISGEDGSIKNNADAKYVEWAHKKGYKVWALFGNNFGDPEKTGEFLRNTDARDNSIRQMLAFAALYKLDGINLDFENMLESDKDALTQYVREVAPLVREQGLTISMDVNTLGCYDRKAIGGLVDYVMLMAYDQHWQGGNVAGSVAELPWTENVIKSFLKDIPQNKLILGIPFYTRLWMETTGGTVLDSKALSMENARKFAKDNKAVVVWDESSGQFKSQFQKDGVKYEVWFENDDSINLRTSLVLKYGLAGTAAWRLDFEEPDVWKDIIGNLKTLASYDSWEKANAGRVNSY